MYGGAKNGGLAMNIPSGSEGEAVRDAIFNSAITLFSRRGFFATTIRDIVEQAGVTQPMVYYYFGNKEQLFVYCVKELFKKFMKRYERIREAKTFRDFVHRYIEVGREIYSENPAELLLMINFLHSADEYPKFPEMKEIIYSPIGMIKEGIAAAKKRGEMSPDVDADSFAIILFGSLVMAASFAAIKNDIGLDIELKAKDFENQLMKILFDGIEASRS